MRVKRSHGHVGWRFSCLQAVCTIFLAILYLSSVGGRLANASPLSSFGLMAEKERGAGTLAVVVEREDCDAVLCDGREDDPFELFLSKRTALFFALPVFFGGSQWPAVRLCAAGSVRREVAGAYARSIAGCVQLRC